MNKNLPRISKFSTDKNFSNNKHAYYSFIKEDNSDVRSTLKNNNGSDNNNRVETLDELFNAGEYIFNIPVYIKTNSEDFSTMIVGKVNDHIITKDNRVIKIKDIVSISVN